MKTLEELRNLLTEQKDAQKALFLKYKDAEGKFVDNIPTEAITEMEAKQAEIDDTLTQIEQKAAEAEKVQALEEKQLDNEKKSDAINARIITRARPNMTPVEKPSGPTEVKSIADAFAEAAEGMSGSDLIGKSFDLDVEFKTIMSTGAGWAPPQVRSGVVALAVTRPIKLFDVLRVLPDYPVPDYRFMQETTLTNNAAERAESVQGTPSAFAESAFALTEVSVPLRMVGHHVPVTIEQLEDVPQVGNYLEGRLAYGAMNRFESQMISGNGTAPNIRGLLNTANIRTQAKGGDTIDDAFSKAIANIQVNGEANPNVVIIHPTDYQKLRANKNAVGELVAGDQRESYWQPIFGMIPIVTTAVPQGTAILLDDMYTEIVPRRGMRIDVTNSHGDDFVNGLVRMRASIRGSIAVYRAPSICQITGL